MARYPYTGRLTDFAEQPFSSATPRLWVSAETPSIGPTGLLADIEIPVPVGTDGSFTVSLVPTVQTSPQTRYVFRCAWFMTDAFGQQVDAGWSEWTITAAIGGGPIKDMASAPASVWFIGPPFPPEPVVGAFYLNRTGKQPYARYLG